MDAMDLTPSCKEGGGQDSKNGGIAIVSVEAMDSHPDERRQHLAEEDAGIIDQIVEGKVAGQLFSLDWQTKLLRSQGSHTCPGGTVANGDE